MNLLLHKPHIAFLRWIWGSRLKKDDLVIDATIGNGHDSSFLLKNLLPEGILFGFDIQQQAIEATRVLIKNENPLLEEKKAFFLEKKCHSLIDEIAYPKEVSLVIYNLGYLPGADKSVTTATSTTLTSIKKALLLLKSLGLITITIYPGHTEGKNEANHIEEFIKTLDHKCFQILHFTIDKENAPYVVVIQKRS